MPPAVQPRLLTLSRTLDQRSCRIICNRRYPFPSRSFHRSGRLQVPEHDGPQPAGHGGDQQPRTDEANSKESVAETEGFDAAEEKRDLRHYGSATRRQQRGRPPKEQFAPLELPTWFSDFNVHLSNHLVTPEAPWVHTISRKSRPTQTDSFNIVDMISRVWSPPKLSLEEQKDREVPILPYFMDETQWMEILYTARGLMKQPLPGFEALNDKNHLLLHCPRQGSSFFLDGIVRSVTYALGSDLVVLDAQDIAELVATTDHHERPSEDMLQAAKLLSYDVYHRKPLTPTQTPDEDGDFMDNDSSAEFSPFPNPATPMQMPKHLFSAAVIGKPIAINVTDLFGSASKGTSRRARPSPKPFLSDFMGDAAAQSKVNKNALSSLIDSIISGPTTKPSRELDLSGEETTHPDTQDLRSNWWTVGGLVIHVRDLTALQDTSFGEQFLSALYENIQGRRMAGEKVIIIGTKESGDERTSYTSNQIDDVEAGERNEISKTVLVIPTARQSEGVFQRDKLRRARMINMRNIWEMLRRKNSRALQELPDGFWQLDKMFVNDPFLIRKLEESVWSYGEVYRLATIIAGMWEHEQPVEGEHIDDGFAVIDGSRDSKAYWSRMTQIKDSEDSDSSPSAEEILFGDRMSHIRRHGTKHEKKLLAGVIQADKIRTTFNDVHAPKETIEALRTLTSLSLIRPDAFLYGVLASDRIPGLMLYGPPGTGKTLLAKAVAKESGATVLQVSGAELNDMYVGEGEKNVKALFSLAKKLTPCVLFIDEVDALFNARGNGRQRGSHRELLNQFLKEWDGMNNDSGSAFIMVATNRPMDLDDAVLRRLPRRLLVDLPTESDRLEILKIHLREEQLDKDVDLASLASRTPFYSGSDLKNLSVAAALTCVKEENDLATSHEGDTPYKHAERRTLTARHFERALDEISASISEDMNSLKEIKKFDEQYGEKRGKKKSRHWGFEAQSNPVLDTVKVRA